MKGFKQYIVERSEESKGKYYEVVLENAWNCKQEGKKSCKGTAQVPISVGHNMVKSLEAMGVKGGVASGMGGVTHEVTEFWKKYFEGGKVPGATKTSKTDVMIGKRRYSMKMGGAQLMSGAKEESTATFFAAANKANKSIKGSLTSQIEAEIKGLADSSVADVKGTIGALKVSKKDKAINKAEKAHKALMETLRGIFNNDTGFAVAFVHEAMSGDTKFGSTSPARAKYILSTNEDGTKIGVYDIDDAAFCAKIANEVRVQVRFKSESEKSKGKKTGYYRYWSVVALILAKIEEEFAAAGPVLNEGILSNIWGKIVEFVSMIWEKIKSWLSESWQNLLAFMEIEPDVNFNPNVNFGIQG